MVKKLYIPGPVEVSSDVFAAMSAPMIGHRMPEYATLHASVTGQLQSLLNTKDPVFLATCSAFGIMEGAVRNLVQKRCANFGNGAFSTKWHDVTKRCGIPADLFSAEWGQPITAEMVDNALASGDYDAMTMVHNETSTGVMSPLAEIAEVMKKYPYVSFIVDTVSSMTAVPIDFEALGLRGYYFDFEEFEKNDLKNNTPSTPCISLIYGLDAQLKKMFVEGLDNRYQRHAEMAAATQTWLQHQGFGLFASEGCRSMTLTSGENDGNTDLEQLKKLVGERGYAMDNGYGRGAFFVSKSTHCYSAALCRL